MQPLQNCIGPTIRIGQKILCLPYAGFYVSCFRIGEQPCTNMLFWQFSNILIYVKIVGKIPECKFNPQSRGQGPDSRFQICPVVFHLFWTVSPGFEKKPYFKFRFDIFPTVLTYIIMLENCQNSISVYSCSPIQGTKFYSY